MNLAEFDAKLKARMRMIEAQKSEAMEAAGELVKTVAKANIGHLQPHKGEFNAWKPLAPSTVTDKQRHGYDFNADHNPLLRTGHLRQSIEMFWSKDGFVVTSSDPVAAYQEFGTSTIPPRPFIRPALWSSLPEINEIVVRLYIGGLEKVIANA